ncbi:MAG: PilZ domain-containing protein [Pseudomonadota bacterium]
MTKKTTGTRVKVKAKSKGPNPSIDARRWRRRKVLWTGTMQVGDYDFNARICDIAPGGAKVKVDLPLKEGARATLTHARFGRLHGHVIWQADGCLGLAFAGDPREVIAAFGDSAAVLGLA